MRLRDKVVLVTGVTGTAGDKIARRCVAEGAEVKGFIRNRDQIALCEELGITPILGDLTDRAPIRAALENVSVIIHAAAYLGADRALAEASNIKGVQNLVDGAVSAGVERFVHISTVSVYGHFDGEVELDEASSLAFGHGEVYISTKCESERIVQAAMANGLPSVILRPGVICSESNSYWGDRLIAKLADSAEVDWIHPQDLTPWVHADNLAEMCVLAAAQPAAVNQCYNAIDGNYPEKDFTMRIGLALNKKFIIPGGDPIRTAYSCDKIKNGLGYRPVKTFEETVVRLEQQARGEQNV
ncbi:NAD-dependent epimerase/dehydratase family protein [Paenibacillus piscarius]|uniref:NAD-dependent epimerase/dehydratase family protein n=1 Tax=Paenibacillus piscarius TaxID=1089681 RepID=UPI001EE900F0|nr:NAD(P)-dependent oxidoreductase [Paenibacillus piscarius]